MGTTSYRRLQQRAFFSRLVVWPAWLPCSELPHGQVQLLQEEAVEVHDINVVGGIEGSPTQRVP